MEDAQRKLYALNLPTNSDKSILESIFGADTIETLCAEPISNLHGIKAVEILFKDVNSAAQAKADFADDGFQLDEGDSIRLMTFDEFANYTLNSALNSQPAEPSNSDALTIPVTPPSQAESEAIAISPAYSRTNDQPVVEVTPEAVTDDEDETTNVNAHNNPTSNQNVGKWKPIPAYDPSDSSNQNPGWGLVDDQRNNGSWEASVIENGIPSWEPSVSDQKSRSDSPSITFEEVADKFMKYMEEQRMNWAEVNNVEELWSICDGVSRSYGGLPDSLLKESLLNAIESQINVNYNNWLRQHLQELLRIWKMEIMREVTKPRETKVVLEAPEYVPPPMRRRNTNTKRRKRGQMLMTVADVLDQARAKYMTEEGELEIDEDEYGNVVLGGQQLDWSLLSQVNKTSRDGVVRANIAPPKPKFLGKRKQPSIPAEQSIAKPMNGDLEMKKKKESEEQEKLRREKEREEGELGGSESDKASASETSSSSSDESDAEIRKRNKRRTQRSSKPAAASNQLNMTSVFSKFYQHRFAILHSLTIPHKAAFLDVLRQTTTSMNKEQQQQMSAMMSAFMQSYQKM